MNRRMVAIFFLAVVIIWAVTFEAYGQVQIQLYVVDPFVVSVSGFETHLRTLDGELFENLVYEMNDIDYNQDYLAINTGLEAVIIDRKNLDVVNRIDIFLAEGSLSLGGQTFLLAEGGGPVCLYDFDGNLLKKWYYTLLGYWGLDSGLYAANLGGEDHIVLSHTTLFPTYTEVYHPWPFDGLVAQWRFDGDFTDSWGDHDGTGHGSYEFYDEADSIFRGYVRFYDWGYMEVPASGELDILYPLTVSFYAKFKDFPYPQDLSPGDVQIVDKGDFAVEVAPDEDQEHFRLYFVRKVKEYPYRIQIYAETDSLGNRLRVDREYHFACVDDGENLRIYVDGKLVKSQSFADYTRETVSTDLIVGENPWSTYLEDLRIYRSVALPASDRNDYPSRVMLARGPRDGTFILLDFLNGKVMKLNRDFSVLAEVSLDLKFEMAEGYVFMMRHILDYWDGGIIVPTRSGAAVLDWNLNVLAEWSGYDVKYARISSDGKTAVFFDPDQKKVYAASVDGGDVVEIPFDYDVFADTEDGKLFFIYSHDEIGTWGEQKYYSYTVGELALTEAPSLVSPEDGSNVGTEVTLEWSAVADADGYHVQVSQDSSFSSLVVDAEVADTSYTATLTEGTYYWRVRSKSGNYTSTWSDVWSFNVIELYPPALLSPEDGEVVGLEPIQVTLDWSDVDRVDEYEVEVATDSGFTNVLLSAMVTVSEYTTPELDAGTYYWRVRVHYSGVVSDWSEVWHFVVSELEAPTLVAPADGHAVGFEPATVKFVWENVFGATGYEIQVATDSDFTSVVVSASTPATEYEVELNRGIYYWRVRAEADGSYSAWSDVWRTRVGAIPALLTPENLSTFYEGENVVFSWENVGADQYELQIDDDPNFGSPDYAEVLTSTEVKLKVTTAATLYWRVRVTFWNLEGFSGTAELTVETRPGPVIVNPATGEEIPIGLTVVLQWEAVENASWYELQIDDDPAFGSPEISVQLETNQYELDSELLGAGTWYWRVRYAVET